MRCAVDEILNIAMGCILVASCCHVVYGCTFCSNTVINSFHLSFCSGRRLDDGSISIDCAEVIQLHGKDASMSEDVHKTKMHAAAWHSMRMHEEWSFNELSMTYRMTIN